MSTMRADARRNYERLVSVAGEVVAEQGAEASLEEIARRAGVGSATLHRHFGSRRVLLEAVFRSRIDVVCTEAEDLLDAPDPGSALVGWLRSMVAHATVNRGLGASLMMSAEVGSACHARILGAGEALLVRAKQHGAADPEVTIGDLLKLVNAISLASEQETELAGRLLGLIIRGVAPARDA